jgi:hypothetical protein
VKLQSKKRRVRRAKKKIHGVELLGITKYKTGWLFLQALSTLVEATQSRKQSLACITDLLTIERIYRPPRRPYRFYLFSKRCRTENISLHKQLGKNSIGLFVDAVPLVLHLRPRQNLDFFVTAHDASLVQLEPFKKDLNLNSDKYAFDGSVSQKLGHSSEVVSSIAVHVFVYQQPLRD